MRKTAPRLRQRQPRDPHRSGGGTAPVPGPRASGSCGARGFFSKILQKNFPERQTFLLHFALFLRDCRTQGRLSPRKKRRARHRRAAHPGADLSVYNRAAGTGAGGKTGPSAAMRSGHKTAAPARQTPFRKRHGRRQTAPPSPWIFAPEKKASPSRPSGASSPVSLPHAFASPFRGRFVRNFFATAFHKKTAGAPLLIGRRRLPFRTQTTKRRMRLNAQARRAAPPEIWRRPAKRPGAFSIPRPAAFPARARAGGNRVPAPRPSQ